MTKIRKEIPKNPQGETKNRPHIPYQATPSGLVQWKSTREGRMCVPLTNFTARICSDVVVDDGAETQHVFEIEAELKRLTHKFTVPADHFSGMHWVLGQLGPEAVVQAGQGAKDHARAAIQLLSGDVPKRRVFTHTGWRKLENKWIYLHARGAIGPSGPIPGVEVRLEGGLANYYLDFQDILPALVWESLKLLEVGPDRVTFPLYAAIFRAILGDPDFSLYLSGPTGVGKTAIAALAQQHFGARMDDHHLPGNWSSADNAIEGQAFAAKDALLIIDDFAPSGTSADIARLHLKADRVMRAQGNASGRQRMRADTSLRPEKPPRGLILSTGEDTPRGQSLRARMLIINVSPGDLDWTKITECQGRAREGVFSQTLASFVSWLSTRYDEVSSGLEGEIHELRQELLDEGHKRTATIVANLVVGFRYFLDYAELLKAISGEEKSLLERRCLDALKETARTQPQLQSASEPTQRFLELVRAALGSGAAHIAAPDGNAPQPPEAFGWQFGGFGVSSPKGKRIGWIDGEDLYLEPEASYQCAQRAAKDSGELLPIASKTLHKRLSERGLLLTRERRDRLLIRKTLEGARREVLHLHRDSLLLIETDQSSQSDHEPAHVQSEDPVPAPN